MGWLLLAAGQGTRFGGAKLLAPMATGKTVFEQTASNLMRTPWPVLTVLHPDHGDLRKLAVELGLHLTECQNASRGMSQSLAWGIETIEKQWSWVGVVLADMPLINGRTLTGIGKLARRDRIVLPVYRPRAGRQYATMPASDDVIVPAAQSGAEKKAAKPGWGHPVCFGSDFFSALKALEGDRGARDLVRANHSRIRRFHTSDPGILQDIDTRQDLAEIDKIQ